MSPNPLILFPFLQNFLDFVYFCHVLLLLNTNISNLSSSHSDTFATLLTNPNFFSFFSSFFTGESEHIIYYPKFITTTKYIVSTRKLYLGSYMCDNKKQLSIQMWCECCETQKCLSIVLREINKCFVFLVCRCVLCVLQI